jgi:ATP diphosphatase
MSKQSPKAVLQVIDALLGPNGCPWDKEQTPESLGDYILEETFELVDAIRRRAEGAELADELGDAFFLLFFLGRLLSDRKQISDLEDVWEANAQKMRGRHPHVFGNSQCESREELHQKWEEIKRQERGSMDGIEYAKHSLASVPGSLPPLLRAYRLHAKAAKAGFTWDSDQDQKAALNAEWDEFMQTLAGSDHARQEEEFGDLLFSLVEFGRRRGIKANAALHLANVKFIDRFQAMLEKARSKGLDWSVLSMEERDALWEEVKKGFAISS